MDSRSLYQLCVDVVDSYWHKYSQSLPDYSSSDMVSELYIKLDRYPKYQDIQGAITCFKSVCLNLIKHQSYRNMDVSEIHEVQSWWDLPSPSPQYSDDEIASALRDVPNRSLATFYRYVTGKYAPDVPLYLRTLIISEYHHRHSK